MFYRDLTLVPLLCKFETCAELLTTLCKWVSHTSPLFYIRLESLDCILKQLREGFILQCFLPIMWPVGTLQVPDSL